MALSYRIQKGKIICFQNFSSTSLTKEATNKFNDINNINLRRRELKFSIIMTIKVNLVTNVYPAFVDIKNLSEIISEEEVLFQPFSFFKVINSNIIYHRYVLELELEAIRKQNILENSLAKGYKLIYDKNNNIIKIDNNHLWSSCLNN